MPNISSFIDALRSLSFGGLVSTGIGGIIYFFIFPRLLVPIVAAKTFVIFCGLLGAGTQQALRGLFRNVVTPVGKFILYYEKLLELNKLRENNVISEEKYRQLIDRLTEERFVGSPLPDTNRQLPPAS